MMKTEIIPVFGVGFTEKVCNLFNPDDLSRWMHESPLDFIRRIRPYIRQIVALIRNSIEQITKKPDLQATRNFDLSVEFSLERILSIIAADVQLIQSSIIMLEAYWQAFVVEPNLQYSQTLNMPIDMLHETITLIDKSNSRIGYWVELLVKNPAFGAVKTLDISEKFTFKYLIESIAVSNYVIDLITKTSEAYYTAFKRGEIHSS